MDVKKIFLLSLLLSACNSGGNSTPVKTFDKKNTLECTNSEIAGNYLVQWKDGSVSTEKAFDENDFKNNFLENNKSDIYTSEPLYKVRAPVISPTPISEPSEWGGDLNWGVYDMQADKLWAENLKGQNVVIAVIDSGVDLTHEALKNSIFINSSEISGNGLDDDNNGFIDDVRGWDFYQNSNEVKDQTGHGTHISGIIAAQHVPQGLLGVSPNAKILPLKFMGSSGDGSVDAAINAIDYAVKMGAQVINASWGGSACSKILKNKVDQLTEKKVLFISAAGNDGRNISSFPEYPAAYNSILQITVGAHTAEHMLAGFSNLGDLVHISAPGANIVSSVPGGYTSLNGTSMATPHVAAAAALLISAFPQVEPFIIKTALLEGVEAGPYKVKSRGAVNIYKSYLYLKQKYPLIP